MYLTGRYIIRHQLRVADTLSDTTPEEPHWPIHYQTPAASRRYIIRHDPRGRTPLHVLRSYPLLDLSTRSILQDLDARVSFLKADTLSDTPGAPFSVYALVCSVWPLSRSRHALLSFQVFTLTYQDLAARGSFPKADTLSDTPEAARGSFPKADTLSDTLGAPFSVYALFGSVWPLS